MQKHVQIGILKQSNKNTATDFCHLFMEHTGASLAAVNPTIKVKKLITRIVFLAQIRLLELRQKMVINFQTAGCWNSKSLKIKISFHANKKP